jgi:aspartyl aminopeptidase
LTAHGPDSNFLPTILNLLSSLPSSKKVSPTAFEESLSKSFLVSADMVAMHPDYQVKYEDEHKPRLNEGVGVKVLYLRETITKANVRVMPLHQIPRGLCSWMRSRVVQA